MLYTVCRLINDLRAATAIEYSLLAALVSLAFMIGASATGVSLTAVLNSVFVEVEQARCVQVGSNCSK